MFAFFWMMIYVLPFFMVFYIIILSIPTLKFYREFWKIYDDSMKKANNDRERKELAKQWTYRREFQLASILLPIMILAGIIFVVSLFFSLYFVGLF